MLFILLLLLLYARSNNNIIISYSLSNNIIFICMYIPLYINTRSNFICTRLHTKLLYVHVPNLQTRARTCIRLNRPSKFSENRLKRSFNVQTIKTSKNSFLNFQKLSKTFSFNVLTMKILKILFTLSKKIIPAVNLSQTFRLKFTLL